MADYSLIENRVNKYMEAGAVPTTLRQVYIQMKRVQAITQRFATDQEFSDMFDEIMMSDGFDATIAISQMMYHINQAVSAWESNQTYRDVLLLPPL